MTLALGTTLVGVLVAAYAALVLWLVHVNRREP